METFLVARYVAAVLAIVSLLTLSVLGFYELVPAVHVFNKECYLQSVILPRQ